MAWAGDQTAGTSVQIKIGSVEDESIEFEFKYYCFLIRELQQYIPEESREKLVCWIHRLVDPLPRNDIRLKRNRYLFMICSALLTRNSLKFLASTKSAHLNADKRGKVARVRGLSAPTVVEKPKVADANGIPLTLSSAVPVEKILFENASLEWEKFKFWEDRLRIIMDAEKLVLTSKIPSSKAKVVHNCSIHTSDCPKEEVQKKVGQCLDNQFAFLLYLGETYQQVTTCEKERTNLWLQALCKIDKDACVEMKGIRNDYIMLMIGYLMNNELKGPFEDLPSGILQPLTQAIATYIAKRKSNSNKGNKGKVPLNPVSETVEAFMNQVPKIVEGAFALLSINGSMFNK